MASNQVSSYEAQMYAKQQEQLYAQQQQQEQQHYAQQQQQENRKKIKIWKKITIVFFICFFLKLWQSILKFHSHNKYCDVKVNKFSIILYKIYIDYCKFFHTNLCEKK